ncbi:sigma-70 region 4 domain-containing protein [Pelomonas sp. SE-A7]|uniref:sigma-70 region 4 domain-containing protein n=1 Tax=Pelomonas sp. SE-A7 TaxID=3054953 RepID=UPI00259CC3CE|nr:sigma-70 region 4 domain-containing protein [Pelomonas sp. SE-A7]MDM4765974.1 sigma factor-like helix-turn-helix DNA-binding protein [Pelomonas sp. SE-A7]
MQTQEPDSAIEALDVRALLARLARTDWQNDPLFIPDEQVFRMFRRAREAGNEHRMGMLIRVLSRRLLSLATGFAVRSAIYPGIIGNLDQAAEELSQFVWDCLVKRPGDAAYAEKRFGLLFKLRATDFQRRLLAKKRKHQESLDAMDVSDEDDDPDKTIRRVTALRQPATPADALAIKQEHAQVVARMQAAMTKQEFFVYTMLYVEDMPVKDIAVALGVTPRTINTYKNAALDKVEEMRKEFTQ